MGPTLTDKLLYLEARMAMAEDRLGVVAKNLRMWGRVAITVLELLAIYVAAFFVKLYLEKGTA